MFEMYRRCRKSTISGGGKIVNLPKVAISYAESRVNVLQRTCIDLEQNKDMSL